MNSRELLTIRGVPRGPLGTVSRHLLAEIGLGTQVKLIQTMTQLVFFSLTLLRETFLFSVDT
jgi:hypothetical protein